MSRSQQESKEMRAFRAFAATAMPSVDSIEERPSPEPDILAHVAEEAIAYELTEAVEPEYAKKLSLLLKTPKSVRDFYARLPAKMRREVDARHHGKAISFCFRDDVSLRKRETVLSGAFQFLLALPPECGNEKHEWIDTPFTELIHISIKQIRWDGIYLDADAPAGWIGPEEALRERLTDKMTKKSYKTEHPIELLVYFEREVTPPPNTGWEDAMKQVAQQFLSDSPFRRVWLFDGWSGGVHVLAELA